MRKTPFIGLASLLLVPAAMLGQQPQSQGDAARPLQEGRATKTESAASSSPQPMVAASNDRNPDLAREMDAQKYGAGVKLLFQQEKFGELERIAAAARSAKARFPGGGWKIRTFYLVMEAPDGGHDASDADWGTHLARLERWTSAEPGSISAPVALAGSYLSYAWKARGSDFADKVSDEAWKLFQERAKMAETVLNRASSLATKCPEWYVVMQGVALAEEWDKKKAAELLETATAFEPQYYYYYQREAFFLLPQWNGEEGETERFAEDAARRVGGREGDFLYFQIASALVGKSGDEDLEERLSWATIKRGYDAMAELYGTSNMWQNQMCYMAAHFGDAALANKLFTQIGEKWDKGIWERKAYFDGVKAWAAGEDTYLKKMLDAYRVVGENLRTREGQQYDGVIAGEFASKYANAMRECVTGPVYKPTSFDIVMQLDKEGTVHQLMFYPVTAPDRCLRPKLEKASFSAPPQANYWVRVTMNIQP